MGNLALLSIKVVVLDLLSIKEAISGLSFDYLSSPHLEASHQPTRIDPYIKQRIMQTFHADLDLAYGHESLCVGCLTRKGELGRVRPSRARLKVFHP